MTEVNLMVNDKELSLNEQMENMLTNIILGYLKSAKKVPEEIETIKIEISL
ncbi:MAG: hypothetical protein ACFFA8_11065 [Promethearchaeota archaeon]